MRCGAPATCSKPRKFSWHPQWIDILIILGLVIFTPLFLVGVICALALTLRMRVWVPLCDAHRNYWKWRTVYISGGAAFFILLGIGCLLFVVTRPAGREVSDLIGLFCVLPAGLGLIWLIVAAIIQNAMIRPTEITSDSITLGRVSREFIAALEKDDVEIREERWQEERRRAPGSQDYYDPKAGRPDRLPSEGFQKGPAED
jgi:hypothetical protein